VTPSAREAASRAADKLGRAVLPHLLGRLDGTTENFRALARRLASDPEATFCDDVAMGRVEEAQGEAHRVGWFLGCLASASGTDLLIARREENGLRLFCGLVLEALAGPGGVVPDPSELPRIATGVGRGWELSFLAGFLFCAAFSGARPEGPLGWTVERLEGQAYLRVQSSLGREDAMLIEAVTGLLPEARASASADRAEIRFPENWLES